MKAQLPAIMRDIRKELEQEASFWRHIIATREEYLNEAALQRVHDALNLVEYKLAQMTDGR